MVKIGRNDICYCGSGIKYKKCCLSNSGSMNRYKQIDNIVELNGYPDDVSMVIKRMYKYLSTPRFYGSCHFTATCLYVALSELGFEPKLYIGENAYTEKSYTHSWITLDDKVIDLAILYPLSGPVFSDIVVFDINLGNNKVSDIDYTHPGGYPDTNSHIVIETSLVNYLDSFPRKDLGVNGGWDVINYILNDSLDIEYLRERYKDAKRINLYDL